MTYRALISQSVEEAGERSLELLVSKAQLNLKSFKVKAESELLHYETVLADVKERKDFSADAVFAAYNDVKLAARKVKFAEELKKELF